MALIDHSRHEARRGPAPFLFGTLTALAMIPPLLELGGFGLAGGALLAVQLSNLAFAAAFALELVVGILGARDRRAYLRREVPDLVLLFLLGLGILVVLLHPLGLRASGLPGIVRPVQVYLVMQLILRVFGLFHLAARRQLNYARVFGLSFLAIIALGVLLLYLLPGAKAEGRELGFVDAVFTATSATCVTGLITVDTGTHFSRFGQIVILVLFQVGGLGLMTFAGFFAIALGRGMGLKDRHAMQGVLNLSVAVTVVRVIVGILLITLLVEGISAVLLYGRWAGEMAPSDRLFHSVFHSVSAFCNAGFSLNAASLTEYASDPVVNLVVMLEIVIGGLGFAVLLDLVRLRTFGARLLTRLGLGRGAVRGEGGGPRLSVQTRIVLVTTVVLILFGAGLFYLFEAGNPRTLGALEPGARVQAAFFQSVTSRTAGFNTVPIGEMEGASQFLTILLMIVGASPGSTGGGVKTVTTVVLLMTLISFYRNRPRVEVCRRTLPPATVNRALVIVVSAFLVVSAATLLLVAVEGGKFDFLPIFFEVGSAFGTVGLSTGITGGLSAASKLTLCLVMLVGRIGPLSLVIALSQARAARGYEYPQEHVMIG